MKCKQEHFGKSPAWWFFVWPFKRRRVQFWYERSMPNMAAIELLRILPSAEPGTKAMVRYLAKKHGWTVKKANI